MASPEHERSGRDIEEGIARAEEGSPVEGAHDLAHSGPSGDSRVERMADVEEVTEGRGGPTAPEPGPDPSEEGSGGAQRIVGARISDRVSGGEPRPDGPPFDG